MTLILWGTSLPLSVPGVFFVVTLLAYLALFGWIPAVVFIFALLPARQAAALAVIGGWLLLPPYRIAVSNFPDYSKITAASLGMMFGTLFFGSHHLLKFRPRWFDAPMLLWCFSGMISSFANGLGMYDGLSNLLSDTLTWGLPYLFGRIYFGDSSGLYTLTVGMIMGGLCYLLPVLWEVRMSPTLLGKFYGSSSWQGIRFGGYRPNVFFNTGLECGMWMTAVSLTAWWLWRCGVVTKFAGIPFGIVWVPTLIVVTFLCRSVGCAFSFDRWHRHALGVRPIPTAHAARGSRALRACLCRAPHPEPLVGQRTRPIVRNVLQRRTCASAAISLRLRETADRQGHPTASIWLGGMEP